MSETSTVSACQQDTQVAAVSLGAPKYQKALLPSAGEQCFLPTTFTQSVHQEFVSTQPLYWPWLRCSLKVTTSNGRAAAVGL